MAGRIRQHHCGQPPGSIAQRFECFKRGVVWSSSQVSLIRPCHRRRGRFLPQVHEAARVVRPHRQTQVALRAVRPLARTRFTAKSKPGQCALIGKIDTALRAVRGLGPPPRAKPRALCPHWQIHLALRTMHPLARTATWAMSTKFHPSRKALIGVMQPRDNLRVPLEILDWFLYQVSFFTGKDVDPATGVEVAGRETPNQTSILVPRCGRVSSLVHSTVEARSRLPGRVWQVHVEAKRFHVRGNPGVASFLGKTLCHTLIHSKSADSRPSSPSLCAFFSHAGEDTGNNDPNARPTTHWLRRFDFEETGKRTMHMVLSAKTRLCTCTCLQYPQ